MAAFKSQSKEQVGFQGKFLIGLAIILFIFSAFAASLIYFYEKNAIEHNAFQKTELVMAAASSMQNYVRSTLRPKMYEEFGDDIFLLEAMSSSFVSRAVMDLFKKEIPNFEYRRVGVDARNPEFEANEKEQEMMKYFRENTSVDNWQGIVETDSKQFFVRYKPVSFSESCQRCHGDPQAAPSKIRDIYGTERGYLRDIDEISGLISVSIPVDASLAKIKEVSLSVFSTVFLTVFFLFGIITFFFNRLIVQNLRQVLYIFHETLKDEKTPEMQQILGSRDEIADIAIAARAMAEHLKETRKMLKDHSENLEIKVNERTKELQVSENNLKANILARNRELQTLNKIAELITTSIEVKSILPKVLEQALMVIPASGAGIYLLDRERSQLQLQCQHNAPQLVDSLRYNAPQNIDKIAEDPEDFRASICDAAYGHINFYDDGTNKDHSLNVPLCCRSKVMGAITFTGTEFKEINAELQELLFSIGRQVGITLDSLQSRADIYASKELLQSVFDGITDLVVLVDEKSCFRMVNKAFLEYSNLTISETLNKSVMEVAKSVEHPFSGCQLILDKGLDTEQTDYVQTKSGVIYETLFYPVFVEKGILKNIICYAKDVTEQRRIEQKMQQTEKLLALGQMAAGVAHEINNPLSVILCYADILRDEIESAQSIKDIETIEKHARGCQRIVADLLNFSRGQTAQKIYHQLNPLIEEVAHVVQTQFRKDKITLLLNLSEDIPDLYMDADKIKQVVMNLLVNASQAIENEGVVSVDTFFQKEQNIVQIIVEDNGYGISGNIIGKIFDPFFTTKGPGEGTGLGLSLAYGIIRDHQGDITVESEPEHWTRFTISLPII